MQWSIAMTYRIDLVKKSTIPSYAWRFEIKGFEGRGEYVTLYTDQDGRKLYSLGSIDLVLVAGTEAFEVPKEASVAEAYRALALFLDQLGWGPMVDQAGNIVDPMKHEAR
jgi:hypothetical protein